MAVTRQGWDEGVLWQESLTVSGDRLASLRAKLGALAGGLGIAEEDGAKLVLAFDEAVQNIIRHGYRDTGAGRLDITVAMESGALCFRLRDYAAAADLAAIRPRPLDELRPGGLGTFFIRTIMDEVTYSHAEDGVGNVLIMRWRLGERRAQD